MFKSFKSRVFGLFALVGSAALNAAPVTVDLSDAQTSIGTAGTALIALAVTMLSIVLVYRFIKNK